MEYLSLSQFSKLKSMWCTHFVCELRLLFFYCTVNSFPTPNSFLTVNSVMHALHLIFYYCAMKCFPTLNSFLTMNSMTHTLWKTLPHYLTLLCCCTLCDARTNCGKGRLLFFYCTLNSFPTMNSVTHALWLRPIWCTHYEWQALLALSIVPWTLFRPSTLYRLWTPWSTHLKKLC